MARVLLFVGFFLFANQVISQRIPLSTLREVRIQGSDSIQSLLMQYQYRLVSVTEPISGKIASGRMKFQFIRNESDDKKEEYFVIVYSNPNLHEMYNSDNVFEIQFSDTSYYAIIKSEIKLNDFRLIRTTFSGNMIKNYYYKQNGAYVTNGEFFVLISYPVKSLQRGKTALFSFQITTSGNCNECLKYALGN